MQDLPGHANLHGITIPHFLAHRYRVQRCSLKRKRTLALSSRLTMRAAILRPSVGISLENLLAARRLIEPVKWDAGLAVAVTLKSSCF